MGQPTTRSLPLRINPLIVPEVSPQYEDLLSRRRLGKTNLAVKPGQIGTSNATRPENLGMFEYAHLRAPLPRDLEGSEIFVYQPKQQNPETYFLMRRSKDGYVSATGMFKIAFPWATHAEEVAERKYVRTLPNTSDDEVAGNVWISPELALELAKDYNMAIWVRALLDPTDIIQTLNSPGSYITPPPKFNLTAFEPAITLEPSMTSLARTRGRRSTSPLKSASPRKTTPRKTRQGRGQREAVATATAANASLQNSLNAVASCASEEPGSPPAMNGESKKGRGKRGKKADVEVGATVEEEVKGEEPIKESPAEAPAGVVPVKTAPENMEMELEKPALEQAVPEKTTPVPDKAEAPVEAAAFEQISPAPEQAKPEPAAEEHTSEAPRGENGQAEDDDDELPVPLSQLGPPPSDAADMLAQARQMVEQAQVSQATSEQEVSKSKRKADDVQAEAEAEAEAQAARAAQAAQAAEKAQQAQATAAANEVTPVADAATAAVAAADAAAADAAAAAAAADANANPRPDEQANRPMKRTKLLTDTLRRERVRNRALVGVTATLALAAAIPYFL